MRLYAIELKDMACRNLLLRLEQAGQIRLPPRQRKSTNGYRRLSVPASLYTLRPTDRAPVWVPHSEAPIEGTLKALLPLRIACVSAGGEQERLLRYLLLRLEQAGQIRLPPRQRKSTNGYRNRAPVWVPHSEAPIEGTLKGR